MSSKTPMEVSVSSHGCLLFIGVLQKPFVFFVQMTKNELPLLVFIDKQSCFLYTVSANPSQSYIGKKNERRPPY
jgi:hypothetical protein